MTCWSKKGSTKAIVCVAQAEVWKLLPTADTLCLLNNLQWHLFGHYFRILENLSTAMKIMRKLDIIKMKVPECLTRIESKRLQVPIMPNNVMIT